MAKNSGNNNYVVSFLIEADDDITEDMIHEALSIMVGEQGQLEGAGFITTRLISIGELPPSDE